MRRFFAPRRGVAIVEFALVAPVTVLLFLSFIQLGLVLSSYVSVTDAARQGARAAILSGQTDAQRIAAARTAALGADCPGAATGLAQSTGTIDCATGVKVTVRTLAGTDTELPYAQSDAERMAHPSRRGQLLTVSITWTVTMDVGLFVDYPDLTVVSRSSMRIE